MNSDSAPALPSTEKSDAAGAASREYDGVHRLSGLFTLNDYGKIAVRGKDRQKFLQGLTTNDLLSLSEGGGLYSLFPTAKGKIASDAKILCFSDFFLLLVLPELREKTLQILKKYKIGSDVQLDDVTGKFSYLSIQGPLSRKVISTVIEQPLPEVAPLHFMSFEVGGATIQVVRNDWSGEEGYDLLIPASGASLILHRLAKGNEEAVPCGTGTFQLVRIEAGLPEYGSELTEDVLPQEAGLEKGVISYTKGCYIGQETIARLHYLGHTNRTLVGLYAGSAVPEKNAPIYSDQKQVGRVTSAVLSPRFNQAIALGFVLRQFAAPGSTLFIEQTEGRVKASVADLPFFRRDPG